MLNDETIIITISELQSYKDLAISDPDKAKRFAKRKYNLGLLPNEELINEMREYIVNRGKEISCSSLKSEIYGYNQMAKFISESEEGMKTFVGTDIKSLEKQCKAWLIKNGKSISIKRKRQEYHGESFRTNEIILYLRRVWKYFNPVIEEKEFVYESDSWNMDEIDINIRKDPTRTYKILSFKKISQPGIKDEIKQILYSHLQYMAVATVFTEKNAINRFSAFLADRYPEICSLTELDRELIEEYLIYTYTECTGRKNYRSDLCHLKTVTRTGAKVLESKDMESLFHSEDICLNPRTLYKYYTEAELLRLNAAIVKMQPQIARLLFLHQLLGTRISEALTLRQDALFRDDDGRLMIRIYQIKTRKTYEKTINEDVEVLIKKSIEYTTDHYGKREYIFVSDSDPDIPMKYSTIQYQLMTMIKRNDLRDDNGELFGIGTHIYRHNYGKRLTDLHTNDEIIAELLGHTSIWSIKYYRKISNHIMTEETRARRKEMDETLKTIMKGW